MCSGSLMATMDLELQLRVRLFQWHGHDFKFNVYGSFAQCAMLNYDMIMNSGLKLFRFVTELLQRVSYPKS